MDGSWIDCEKRFLALMADRSIESSANRTLFETPTVLFCSEATADHCHRRLVLEYLDVLDVLYLDRSFGVGYQATLYRLQNLGWIGREQHVQLAHHRPEVLGHALGVADERARDEGPTAAGRYPPRYVYLALEAYRQAKVSLGKLAELLGQSLEDVRDLV